MSREPAATFAIAKEVVVAFWRVVEAESVVEESVAFVEKTVRPEPVSSPRSAASSLERSREVVESLFWKMV